jgi:uncharacterized protein YndB with AHSA1/START domain
MPKLFVEQSMEIEAPASRVWEILTRPELSREWIRTWWPELQILQSDWRLGSKVEWKLGDGKTGAEGKVTAVDPPRSLRYGFQVNAPGPIKREEVAYELDERAGRTKLSVSVGDFGDTPEHEQCYPGAVEAWKRCLPKIKELAETPQGPRRSTTSLAQASQSA